MNDNILIRLVWSILILLSALVAYWLVSRAVLARARSASRASPQTSPGIPSILYFTTPDCAPCRTVQRPALQQVKQALGNRLQVVEVDAYEEPELARQWGVLSVPTTFILDASGSPRHVNHGAAPTNKLFHQLQDVL
jgi:thiol-disulfide isomerase/thioredoxin